jgi:hypothetical protein
MAIPADLPRNRAGAGNTRHARGMWRRRLDRAAGRGLRVAVLLAACNCAQGAATCAAQTNPPAKAGTVGDNVRTFMRSVAHDVTQNGPTAWLKYFDDSPAFFMAVNGAMAFPNPSIARDGTKKFAATIQHIELRWGDDLRVDPLAPGFAVVGTSWSEIQIDQSGRRVEEGGYFTGVVERRRGRWMFRDAHWSSPVKAPVAQ